MYIGSSTGWYASDDFQQIALLLEFAVILYCTGVTIYKKKSLADLQLIELKLLIKVRQNDRVLDTQNMQV